MLTVRFERLQVRPGDRLLDLGAGLGRHAFEAMRRGAVVTALDADVLAVKDLAAMMAAITAEETITAARDATSAKHATGTGRAINAVHKDVRPPGLVGTAIVGDALCLPFSSEMFHRVIAAEVLEHIPDDRGAISELARVLRPGGTLAVTVPRWWPELLTWALSDDYHTTPGGHIRIYRRSVLVERLRASGLEPYASHHAHALHSPYWWLRALVGVADDAHPWVRAYHRMLVWDITAHPPVTRVPEALLNPVLGKSVVVYLRKPV